MVFVTKTFLPDKNKYLRYIDRIYQSGWITNRGELVVELEKRLAEVFGVRHVILVANGTLALQVLYRAMELKGEVITTPFSFVATTSSLVWERLKPVFADIHPATYSIDCDKIEALITPKTSAIVAVHVYGNPCEVERLTEIASKYRLRLIFDAAHAFHVRYRGKNLAAYGDASTFSFHATKIFHTIEGGAIVVHDDALADKIRLMINFGIARANHIPELGINCKMNEFQAAMGLCMLGCIDENIEKRKRIHDQYNQGLRSNPCISLQKTSEDTQLNYSYFPILLDSEEHLVDLVSSLNGMDIFPRRYFYPSLESLPYIKKPHLVPVSDDISRRILCLPIFEDLPEEVQAVIIDKINEQTGK